MHFSCQDIHDKGQLQIHQEKTQKGSQPSWENLIPGTDAVPSPTAYPRGMVTDIYFSFDTAQSLKVEAKIASVEFRGNAPQFYGSLLKS